MVVESGLFLVSVIVIVSLSVIGSPASILASPIAAACWIDNLVADETVEEVRLREDVVG